MFFKKRESKIAYPNIISSKFTTTHWEVENLIDEYTDYSISVEFIKTYIDVTYSTVTKIAELRVRTPVRLMGTAMFLTSFTIGESDGYIDANRISNNLNMIIEEISISTIRGIVGRETNGKLWIPILREYMPNLSTKDKMINIE